MVFRQAIDPYKEYFYSSDNTLKAYSKHVANHLQVSCHQCILCG